MKKFDLLITGVGGQGVVLASDIVSEAALAAGYDVKKTDTLGMAQRGGSVVSHVRVGEKVWSPLIQEGEADLLLAFEKLEAARWASYLRHGATVIVNDYALPPLSVTLGSDSYPGDAEITRILKQRTEYLHLIDGASRAREAGNVRTLNILLLGCVSLFMPFKVGTWESVISTHVPPQTQKVNLAAFAAGRKELRDAHIG